MATQQPYTNYQELKAYLRISSNDDDAYLKMMIPKVMGYIDSYTHRTFGWGNPADPSDMTAFKDVTNDPGCANGEIYDGVSGQTIYLTHADIQSVDEVLMGTAILGQYTALSPNTYLWRDDGRIILGGNFFNSFYSSNYQANNSNIFGIYGIGYQAVAVKYHYGYFGVPPEISLACLEICAAMYTMRKMLGVKKERIGDWEVDYQANIRAQMAYQPDSLKSLDMFRKINASVAI